MPARRRPAAGPGEGTKERAPGPSAKPCPICGKPASEANKPFCSPRCRDVDLNRWLSGRYTIPGRPIGDEDDE
ncbi:MAG TPA: DNA gyrase inhibitor YacG [Bradyrhizobium sp.]|nr:DNA gyrase inhibitor YacG [Bradyrhizobium sp.]